ncbi:MAG: hypothetical protein KDK12_18030 [Rhodobacteraceae bacterium]|nr:hypothetical protein [Paracoccaceae bacterium]
MTSDNSLRAILAESEEKMAVGARRAMVLAAAQVKATWRGQVVAAGLGERLARSIRSKVYPDKPSTRAAALIWTKAPSIIGAHAEGAVISAARGKWLAIPRPEAGFASGRAKITPAEWSRRNGIPLRFVPLSGGKAMLVADDTRLNSRGLARRKGGRRRKDGILSGAQTVPIFSLVRIVTLRKRLELASSVRTIESRLPIMILNSLPRD